MDQASLAQYVSGFYDGEGSMSVNISEHKAYAIGHSVGAQTRITQTYVAGLVDAEGHIGFHVTDKSDDRNTARVGHRVEVGHTENAELLAALEEFSEYLGINPNVQSVDRSDTEWRDVFKWCISNRRDLEIFLREIRDYTIVKQPEIDLMLDEILPRLDSGYHSNRRQFLELVAWRDVLNSHKTGARGKYNLEYFEDLWGMELEADRLPAAHPRNAGTEEVV